jgi:G3E family GTPase
MLPLTLITGFLGSGKTTLLRRVLERARSRRIACIVNEFASVDIDGKLIELPPGQLVSIPGGSIFCHCLVGEFIRVLGEVADRFEPPRRGDGVVVEASGIADPRVAVQMLRETRLDERYDLRRIVTVVDPGSFLGLIHTLPSIIAQVENCDLAVINKVDLHDPGRVAEAREQIRRCNPAATVLETSHGRVEFDLFLDGGAAAGHAESGEYAACADPRFVTRTLGLGSTPLPADLLNDCLAALLPVVYRAKGFVPATAGRLYVDISAGGVACRPASEPSGEHVLAVITAPQHARQVDEILQRLLPPTTLNVL